VTIILKKRKNARETIIVRRRKYFIVDKFLVKLMKMTIYTIAFV